MTAYWGRIARVFDDNFSGKVFYKLVDKKPPAGEVLLSAGIYLELVLFVKLTALGYRTSTIEPGGTRVSATICRIHHPFGTFSSTFWTPYYGFIV
jgi:hypothetical protein